MRHQADLAFMRGGVQSFLQDLALYYADEPEFRTCEECHYKRVVWRVAKFIIRGQPPEYGPVRDDNGPDNHHDGCSRAEGI